MVNIAKYPGPTAFHQAMNCIGALIFERGRRDLDFAVSTMMTLGQLLTRLSARRRQAIQRRAAVLLAEEQARREARVQAAVAKVIQTRRRLLERLAK